MLPVRGLKICNIAMKGNKLRLYLGYWRRPATATNPAKYHVGLLLMGKKPGNNAPDCRKCHATNPIDPITKVQTWRFNTDLTKSRTVKLAGVMLLGKVPPEVTPEGLEEILKKVYVPTPEKAGKINWRCRHWVAEALERLEAEGIIPTLPSPASEVRDTGASFVDVKTAAADGLSVFRDWLYTCDMTGKEISSEIMPLEPT
ncbi:hypothetical protein B0H34DRAFT_496544 [Crassisporium funariophilum]|nr:hypothetical protein B0H34DRAFT_496544 [Crassisporium funariophilum]